MYHSTIPTSGFVLLALPLLALMGGKPSLAQDENRLPSDYQVGGEAVRTVNTTTEEGVFMAHERRYGGVQVAVPLVSRRPGWRVSDSTALGRAVAIDESNVWGGWQGLDGRFTMYPIPGGGTPGFEFSSYNTHNVGVASTKGADRVVFVEGNFELEELWLHAFTSMSDGMPDWSFELPSAFRFSKPRSNMVDVSYDGSTVAVASEDLDAEESTLWIFDAETGEEIFSWTDSREMSSVELTDDGSIALVSLQSDVATAVVIDTETGEILFETEGSGGGNIHYRISGDGEVLVVGGFDLDVYEFDGETYQPVIEFTLPISWFGSASIVSRDGSTVGTFAGDALTWLEGQVVLFDVATREVIGSYSVSGSGDYQGISAAGEAASSNDGSVMAFSSWGTEFQEWPEIMVFNRDVEMIGEIAFPGSAYSVDVSADGQYVVGAAKAVHANTFGNGGDVELIEFMPVNDEASPDAPSETLSAPSPNPASGISRLILSTERGQEVTVEVFDVTGRYVQTLYDGALAAGMSEVLTFDASALPAGVYAIRATGEGFSKTQRVTVVK